MKREQHPQNRSYEQLQHNLVEYRDTLRAWKASGETLEIEILGHKIRWTYERARKFARNMSELVQAYNRVLWEQFKFCQQCGGQCCSEFMPGVGELDALLLALLELDGPVLGSEIECASAEECIYRTRSGCAWPAQWKPMYCWTFYCPGRGQPWPADEVWDPLLLELEFAVSDLLPDELRLWEKYTGESFVDYFDEENLIHGPEDLAEALDDAMYGGFFRAFDDRFLEDEEDWE